MTSEEEISWKGKMGPDKIRPGGNTNSNPVLRVQKVNTLNMFESKGKL